MNVKKSILTSLVLAVIGMFLAGCCSTCECPIRKLFGAKSQSEASSAPEATPAAK